MNIIRNPQNHVKEMIKAPILSLLSQATMDTNSTSMLAQRRDRYIRSSGSLSRSLLFGREITRILKPQAFNLRRPAP